MGYGGKVKEQLRARELRAQSWTLQDIATELGVSKSSVSLWVRDVDFVPNPRRRNYWTHEQTPSVPGRQAGGDRAIPAGRNGGNRHPERARVLRAGACALRRGGKQDPAQPLLRQQRSADDLLSTSPGSDTSSRSMSRSFESSCTSTMVWTWIPQSNTGQSSRVFRSVSSRSRIAPSPIRPSAERSTSWAVRASRTTRRLCSAV